MAKGRLLTHTLVPPPVRSGSGSTGSPYGISGFHHPAGVQQGSTVTGTSGFKGGRGYGSLSQSCHSSFVTVITQSRKGIKSCSRMWSNEDVRGHCATL